MKQKHTAYWMYTIGSVVLSGILEMILVYPQLFNTYSRYLDYSSTIEELWMDLLFVTIRNGGLVLLAFTFNEIFRMRKQGKENALLICDRFGFIDVKDAYYKTVLINVESIYYCLQKTNFSYIHTLDGKKYTRYCSMNTMEDMLKASDFIRISRNVIVSKPYISKYHNNQVEMRGTENNNESLIFQVGDAYAEPLKDKLMQNTVTNVATEPTRYNKQHKKKKEQAVKQKRVYNTKTEAGEERTIEEEFKNNPKLLAVFQYIESRTDSSAKDICSVCNLHISSVNRYLSILMKYNLVQHTGSRRYGGYNVVKAPLDE